MASALESVLGYKTLLGFIETVKTGVPTVLPREMFTKTKPCIGFTGQYTQAAGSRQTAKVVPYGAPAISRGRTVGTPVFTVSIKPSSVL
jgi:hypothetical protein